MSKAPQNQPHSASLDDEQLVAYLDGELEPADARRLEDRLAGDTRARARLNQLAASWDLLDQLPRATVDDAFARTTVEMVAVSVEEEVAQTTAAAPAKAKRRWLLGILVALVAAAAGFAVVALAMPDRNDPLLRDLPVVQNLEVYRQVGDIDFARRLSAERLFIENTSDAQTRENIGDASDETIPESIGERRAWVESLEPAEKTELRRNFERFEALPTDEQQALRTLDQQLRADPQGDALRRVCERYHDWLKTRSPVDRAELAEESNAQRKVAAIERLRSEQDRRTFARFGGGGGAMRESDPFNHWLFEFAQRRQPELLALASEEQRQRIQRSDEPGRRGMLLSMLAWQKWWSPSADHAPPLGDDDLASLRKQMPLDQQQKLRDAPDGDARVNVARDWVRVEYGKRFASFGGGRGAPNPERLEWFFHNRLSPAERQRLLGLEEDARARELRKLYDEQRQRSRDSGRPPRGPPRPFGPSPPGGPAGPDDRPGPSDDSTK